jgi:tRNA (mo5U34)-methyltransferase
MGAQGTPEQLVSSQAPGGGGAGSQKGARGHVAADEPGTGKVYWYHSIDFGDETTLGQKSPELLDREWDELQIPPLHGKSVLDIGAWDGYFSFRAEREGAKRVVALDHYVWATRLVEQQIYYRRTLETGEKYVPPHLVPSLWDPNALPGRAGFDLAEARLRSDVEPVVADFAHDDLSDLGTFDVVIFVGVLYHLEDPMGALRKLASLTNEVALIRTVAVHVPGVNSAMWEFYPDAELEGDSTNWWAPNAAALEGATRAAGFRSYLSRTGTPPGDDAVVRYLLTAQASK